MDVSDDSRAGPARRRAARSQYEPVNFAFRVKVFRRRDIVNHISPPSQPPVALHWRK